MNFRLLAAILPFCWGMAEAQAQIPTESSSLPPEQWELTLDTIKSKAQSLMVENNGLQDEYEKLKEQLRKLQQEVDEQKNKNTQMERFLKERHGRTDQQQRIIELTQMIKTKSRQTREYAQQWVQLHESKEKLDQNIRKLQDTISQIDLQKQAEEGKAQATPSDDEKLVQLRKQLEGSTQQEALLESQLEDLRKGKVPGENALPKKGGRSYEALKKRKEELEARISVYESRMEQLRQISLTSLSGWPQIKRKLVHEAVELDGRNNKLRGQIKILREDIGVLKDQIAKLQRKVGAGQQ